MTRYLAGAALAAMALGFASEAMAFGPTNCRDPWIAQAIYQNYRRMPYANSPTTEECDITHYNGGHWNTYGDLVGYVRRVVPATPILPVTPFKPGQGDNSSLRMWPGTTVAGYTFNTLPQRDVGGVKEVRLNNVWYVIAAGGGNVVAAGGGNLLSTNGGNFIGHDTGNSGYVVAAGGGNVIAAGGGNVVAAGGGNITLFKAAQQ